MDRRTVSRYVKGLIEMGLLEEDDKNKVYVLKNLESANAMLIPFTTLREILNSLNRNSVNLFVYLLNRFIANKEQPFIVTHKEMKEHMGIATSTTSNNVIVNDILKMLVRIQLVEFEVKRTDYDNTNIYITKVRNMLPEKNTGLE